MLALFGIRIRSFARRELQQAKKQLTVVTLDDLVGEALQNFKITILGQKVTRCHALCTCVTSQQ